MLRLRIAFFTVLVFAAAMAAGCGAGGGGAVPAGGAKSPNATTSVKLKLVIPKAPSSSTRRRPAYVSSSMQSVVVLILGASAVLNSGNDYFNVATSACTTGDSGTTCTLNVPASISSSGSYQMVIATYDAAQTATCTPLATPACAGNLLSLANLTETITVGSATPVNVTMGGVPAFLQPLQFVSGEIGGAEQNNNELIVYGPGAKKLQFEFLDADKNVIVGGGVPVVTATGGPALMAAVTQPTSGSGVYTLTLTPTTVTSAVGPVVQPTTVPLDVSATIPNGAAGFSVSPLVLVQVRHSAIYVTHYTGTDTGILTVDAYLDGNNSTPYTTGYQSGTSYLGLATDASDDLWVADAYNNDLIEYAPLDPSITPSEAATVTGTTLGYPNPYNLTFDLGGQAYVAFCGSCFEDTPNYAFVQYPAPGPTSTPMFTAGFTFFSGSLTSIGGVAVDNNESPSPHIYAGVDDDGAYSINEYNSGSTSATVLPFPMSSPGVGLAIEPESGNLWVLQPGPSTATATEINASTGSVLNTIGGLPLASSGIAVDFSGNVFIAAGGGVTGLVEYSPPSFSTPTTVTSALWPVSVAVVPNSLFGENNHEGINPPLPTPYPLPTP